MYNQTQFFCLRPKLGLLFGPETDTKTLTLTSTENKTKCNQPIQKDPNTSYLVKVALSQKVHSFEFCFISNGPTSLFILSVAYKLLLIKQN